MLKGSGTAYVGRTAQGSSTKALVTHSLFDMYLCENIFQRAKAPSDEKYIADMLIERAQSLTPSEHEQALLDSLVAKVKGLLEGLASVSAMFESVNVEEVHLVGSYKMETLMAGHGIADIVIVLKSLPASDTVYSLAQKVTTELRLNYPSELFGCSRLERGAEISSSDAAVRIFPATLSSNLAFHDPKLHVDRRFLEGSMTAVRHAKWFEDNAYHINVKILVRVIRDMKNRYEGFASLNPWLICVLAHFCVMNNPDRQPLAINIAFKRCLQLLSAGFFLPTSSGINDPCEVGPVRIHMVLSNQQQDQICYTAQTLLRINSHGGIRHLLGFELHPNILRDISDWNGIVVTPSDRVYERKGIEDME